MRGCARVCVFRATRQNISHFCVNIHSRNKVDIEIRATDGGSQATPPHRHNNDLQLQSQLRASTDTNPQSTTAAFVSTPPQLGMYRAPTRTRADVSTCLSITDCSGVVDREGGRSFSFGRLSFPPPSHAAIRTSPSLQAATPIPILLLYTRRFQFSLSPLPFTSFPSSLRRFFFVFLYRLRRCNPPRLSSSLHLFISLSLSLSCALYFSLSPFAVRRRFDQKGSL